jgi:hypothetical protein
VAVLVVEGKPQGGFAVEREEIARSDGEGAQRDVDVVVSEQAGTREVTRLAVTATTLSLTRPSQSILLERYIPTQCTSIADLRCACLPVAALHVRCSVIPSRGRERFRQRHRVKGVRRGVSATKTQWNPMTEMSTFAVLQRPMHSLLNDVRYRPCRITSYVFLQSPRLGRGE